MIVTVTIKKRLDKKPLVCYNVIVKVTTKYTIGL